MTVKKILKSYFGNFVFFYSYLRFRVYILLIISFLGGLLDGIGLTLFVPLLSAADGFNSGGKENLGELKFVVDTIEYLGIPLTLNGVIIIMALIFILKGILKYYENFYRAKLRLFFMKKLRFRMIDGMANMRYEFFIGSDAGMIQNTLSGEVQRVISAYQQYFITIQAFVLLVLYIVLAFLANPQFATLVLIAGILTNLFYRSLYRITKRLSKEVTSYGHGFQGFLIQSVSYFKYLKATDVMSSYKQRLKYKVLQVEESQLKIGRIGAILTGVRESLTVLIILSVMFIQVNFFDASIAAMILSLLFFYRSIAQIMSVQNGWNNFLNNSGALENVKEFLAIMGINRDKEGSVLFQPPIVSISLQNVTFSYPNSDQLILNNVSLTINPKETVALVGESGSGKTTFVNLLCGLFQNYSGSFQINGSELRDIKVKSWQQHIGYITQEPVIFDDTIVNNVSLWDYGTNVESRVNEALEHASLLTFVNGLDNRQQSRLGNNGIMVSGGQKQRISIARELYKKVRLLVMDEATSALDSETERSIQANVDSLKGKLTIIIIAHRLSTVKNADKIIILNQGRVEDVGTFNELMKRSPKFINMVSLQEF